MKGLNVCVAVSLAGVRESAKRRKGEFINILVGNRVNVKV